MKFANEPHRQGQIRRRSKFQGLAVVVNLLPFIGGVRIRGWFARREIEQKKIARRRVGAFDSRGFNGFAVDERAQQDCWVGQIPANPFKQTQLPMSFDEEGPEFGWKIPFRRQVVWEEEMPSRLPD